MEKFLMRSNQNKSNAQITDERFCDLGSDSIKCLSYDLESEKTKNINKLACDDSVTIPKRIRLEKDMPHCNLEISPYSWRIIEKNNLRLKYTRIFSKSIADNMLKKLEEEVRYFSGDLLKVKVYGKWHTIPRKQVSFGNPGLSYSFSGNCIPALPWDSCKTIRQLKEAVESVCQCSFNFALVNRYKDGSDYIGEHRDDEKDLEPHAPIASLSLGQKRDFIFRHKDARVSKQKVAQVSKQKDAVLKQIDPVKLELEHGSLLLMEWPTNKFWYHKLPVRKNAPNVRVNLTFRQMVGH